MSKGISDDSQFQCDVKRYSRNTVCLYFQVHVSTALCSPSCSPATCHWGGGVSCPLGPCAHSNSPRRSFSNHTTFVKSVRSRRRGIGRSVSSSGKCHRRRQNNGCHFQAYLTYIYVDPGGLTWGTDHANYLLLLIIQQCRFQL